MDTGEHRSGLDVAALVEIARSFEGQEAVAEAICAHAVAGLGLTGASLGLVRGDGESAHLESIAAVGQLSPFIRDMSTPLGTATDATRTALGGEPIFVGNPHGVTDGGDSDGVGRWRSGFGSHAYAVLALTVREGILGVLTLEWPEPQPFPAETRQHIQLFADVAAIVLRGVDSASATDATGAARLPAREHAQTAEFGVSASGLVVPAKVADAWQEPPVVRIWTATSSREASTDCAALAEVVSAPADRLMLVIGTLSSGAAGRAGEVAVAGRQVVRAAAMHGSAPREVLGMLGSAMRAQPQGAWASAIAATLQPSTGALAIADTGGVAMLTLHRGGRLELVLPETPAQADADAQATGRWQLALPGDRVALISGQVASLADPACVAAAQQALADLPATGGIGVVTTLLALVYPRSGAAAVALFEIAEAAGAHAGS